MMKNILYKKGFTLIELLVVISIIGILTSIVTANFAASRAKARDAKRVSDIAQLQLTLEMVYDRCHLYPTVNQFNNIGTQVCNPPGQSSPVSMSSFLGSMPKDPTTKNNYAYNVETPNRMDYVIKATLESYNQALEDDVDGSLYNQACNDSNPPYYYCVRAK